MESYENFGHQTSVQSVEKIKRDSEECKYCNIKNCRFSSSIALFESNHHVEIDCWLRNYNKKYITGYHLPISTLINCKSELKNIIKWNHILNDKYSIVFEKGMYN